MKDESTDAEHRGGAACSSEEGSVMETNGDFKKLTMKVKEISDELTSIKRKRTLLRDIFNPIAIIALFTQG